FVMHMSYALRHYWFIIFPAIAGIIFGFRRWKRTEQGRQMWDRFKLRIPMRIGDVVHKIALARFSRTLSTLVSSGVDIIKALEITGATSGNWVVEQATAHIRTRVHEGVPVSEPMAERAQPAERRRERSPEPKRSRARAFMRRTQGLRLTEMAPRSLWSGSISFGLVNAPVRIYSAVGEHKLHFHFLHVKDDS